MSAKQFLESFQIDKWTRDLSDLKVIHQEADSLSQLKKKSLTVMLGEILVGGS